MEAIILAGGFGSRLKSVVPDLPKPMAPVNGKPFLQILLETLAVKKFKRVLLSVHFMADTIKDYFGDNYLGMEIVYVYEVFPLGTGGAIRNALDQSQEDKIFVFNGDTYIDVDVDAMSELWEANHNPVLVGRSVQDASRYGALEVRDGYVYSFSEKETSGPGLINAGCYLLPKDILNSFELGVPFSFENEFLRVRMAEENFMLHEAQGYFIDIGIPEDYLLAQTTLS
jgi:D-glycero-alpha-D-manno-heptose 1-phosphate guanylyltransferase